MSLVVCKPGFFDQDRAAQSEKIVNAVANVETLIAHRRLSRLMAIPTDLFGVAQSAPSILPEATNVRWRAQALFSCIVRQILRRGRAIQAGMPASRPWNRAGIRRSSFRQGTAAVFRARDLRRVGPLPLQRRPGLAAREKLDVAGMLTHVRMVERRPEELDSLRTAIGSSDLLVKDENCRGRFLAFRTNPPRRSPSICREQHDRRPPRREAAHRLRHLSRARRRDPPRPRDTVPLISPYRRALLR